MTRRVSRGHDCGCGAASSSGNQSIAFLRTRLSCPQSRPPQRSSRRRPIGRGSRERAQLQIDGGFWLVPSVVAASRKLLVIATARHWCSNEANQPSRTSMISASNPAPDHICLTARRTEQHLLHSGLECDQTASACDVLTCESRRTGRHSNSARARYWKGLRNSCSARATAVAS